MIRRRAAVACLAASAVVVAVAGCQQVRPVVQAQGVVAQLPPRPLPRIALPTSMPVPSARPRPLPRLADGSRRLLPGHCVVAFYGAAGTAQLGVLGAGSPDDVWPRLVRQAHAYRRDRCRRVLPAYELIAFAATRGPGNQHNFSSRVSDRVIARYATAARRHGALLVLDIQPGRGDFLRDARSLRRWLRLPYVGLGLDPEWKLYGAERPLQRIGHTDAAQVNRVSAWLSRLTARARLPQKLLLVHEFTDAMVRHAARVRASRQVAIVFNVDGFGSRSAKAGRYVAFARASRFALGFKLFYDMDVGLMTPRAVLGLRPAPVVVEYE